MEMVVLDETSYQRCLGYLADNGMVGHFVAGGEQSSS
jgi:hypothetical protein